MVERSAPPPVKQARRQAQREVLGLIFVGVVLVTLAVAFAWPWIPPRAAAYADRNRFAPVQHGDGRLFVRRAADGEIDAWISENVSLIPASLALTGEIPEKIRDSLLSVIPIMYELGQYPAGAQLYQIRSRTWTPDNTAEVLDTYVLRDPDGDHLLGLVSAATDTLIDYVPPLIQLPTDLSTESTTAVTGTVISQYPYTAVVDIRPTTRLDGVNCREVQSLQTIGVPNAPIVDDILIVLCAEHGAVSAMSYVDGTPAQRISKVFPDDLQSGLAPPPVDLSSTFRPPIPQASWTIMKFAQAKAWYPGPATTPPVYLPGDGPAILIAAQGGILSALSAQSPETLLWTWQAGSDIYSAPSIDFDTGQLYFGSSDRRLTALTVDGLFLWQQTVGDNIGASPLLVNGAVIVPSEDATLYAFDSATGKRRWSQPLDGSSVSRPAVARTNNGDLLISATDKGVVSAHNVDDGSLVWTQEVEGAIAAGILADDGTVYVTQLQGAVSALDAALGDEIWTTTIGWPIRFTPALGRKSLYLVNEDGGLLTLDRMTGRISWQDDRTWHVGTPTILYGESDTEYILAAVTDGGIDLFDQQGNQIQHWTNSSTVDSTTLSFAFGVITGGNAYWLADSSGSIWRLGRSAE